MALTPLEVKWLTCPEGQKQIKKADGNGLHLLVKAGGGKCWRFRYMYNGKYQELALGQYPGVSLAEARKLATEARALLTQGVNPTDERKGRRRAQACSDRLFRAVALTWWKQQKPSWSEDHGKRVKRWIEVDLKMLGDLPVDGIDQGHLVDVLTVMEAAGARRKAPVVLAVVNRIFGYALAHRLTRSNPAQGLPLGDILAPAPKVQHRAAITRPAELVQLIRAIDFTEGGSYCTVQALRLLPRLFLRPGEVRNLKWEHIDWDQKLIIIPAEDMKRGREHLVPLADQVIEQLQSVQEMTGYSPYVFPNQRDSDKPLSKNVFTNRLRDLGYAADVMSAHGFRATASTLLHEQGWPPAAIEAQLSHVTGTATTRAYNRSIYLAERREMMQAWADQLDALRDGAKIIAIGGRK